MRIKLSDGEWKLMSRLWEKSPMTITALTASLKEETGWSKNTVITMLSRLEGKGAVRSEAGARAKEYYPQIAYNEALRRESESFLEKVKGSGLCLMMSAMAESGALNKEDIEELSAILEKAGEKND